MKQGSSYHYYQNDHLGTPRKLTNNVGAQTWGATYQVYGAANVAAAGATNNLRFPGQYGDPETGLYHNFQRNYDPGLGGYLEQDPFGVAFTGANRHWYAAGNPGIYSDPTGEHPAVYAIYQVLYWSGIAATGYAVYQCLDYYIDGCLFFSGEGKNCFENPLESALEFGAGVALGGAGRVGTKATKRGAKLIPPLRFSQVTASRTFDPDGFFAGNSIRELAAALRRGALDPRDVPVEYVVRDGNRLIVNTRSSLALRRAGIPESEWNLIDRTGVAIVESKISKRLTQNGLGNDGTDVIRITGLGKNASAY